MGGKVSSEVDDKYDNMYLYAFTSLARRALSVVMAVF